MSSKNVITCMNEQGWTFGETEDVDCLTVWFHGIDWYESAMGTSVNVFCCGRPSQRDAMIWDAARAARDFRKRHHSSD